MPNSLSREARGNIGKIVGALSGLLAGAKKGTGIFTACNAIDHNFMSQEDDLLQRKKQEEEGLTPEQVEGLLASLSPVNQAKESLLEDLRHEGQLVPSSSMGQMTRKGAYYSRQCKDYLREFSRDYPRLSTLGLKALEGGGMALEGLLILGACGGPQGLTPLCWSTLLFVGANHSGLTGQAFDQVNKGIAWSLEQGGAYPYDAQEVAPWLSGSALVLAGGTKAINLSNLGKQLSLKGPSSLLSLEVGSQFPYQAKAYLREIEQITGRSLQPEQRVLLKKIIQEEKHMKLSQKEYKIHRDLFDQNKNKLILQWEAKTGQTWPTYESSLLSKEGKIVKRVGNKYDAHEIIPNEYGGPLEWFNIHPARFPDQHQAGIHGKDSSLNRLLKNLESSK